MRRLHLAVLLAVGTATIASIGLAQQKTPMNTPPMVLLVEGPYKVLKAQKVGGDGGF